MDDVNTECGTGSPLALAGPASPGARRVKLY